MDGTRPRWWRLLLATPPTVVAGGILAASWSGLRGSHPAYAATLVATAAVGVVVMTRALRAHVVPERRPGAARRAGLLAGRGTALVLVVALTAALVWLRPFAADGLALAALRPGYDVDRTTTFTRIDLAPVGRRATAGLVFYPGARVDPRAYLPLLTQVAQQGYRVVVLKPPYDLAVLDPGAADRVVRDYAEVERWAVGGHSLGGTMAARYAGRDPAKVGALVLWASYPARDLRDMRAAVTSVYGTRDGLATVSDIEASRADLPDGTTYVPVEGGVHAFFGDYGDQPGDGRPTTDRATAQTTIVEATVAALRSLETGGG